RMPVNGKGEVWKKNRLISGVEYIPTKEFFTTQSDLDSRISEYNSSTWKPRHDLNAKCTTWGNAKSAETKALGVLRDKFHPMLLKHIANKVSHSVLPLKDLIVVISKNCESLIKGEEVRMENGDDLVLSCQVKTIHKETTYTTYTVHDGTREILRVPSAHLRRPHELTPFDIETFIKLTCTFSDIDRSWQADEVYKKEFGMKEKLAPIFCKPQNGTKKGTTSSEDDDVIALPSLVKKEKRESNDSSKENGVKKTDKEKKPKKRKEENKETKEAVEKKKTKKEMKEEVAVNLESTDDEAPLSVLAEKMKGKKQKQGFLDKFLTTASPSSSKGSPSKKQKGKVTKAIEPLIALYKGEDPRMFVHECDSVIKTITKEMMDSRLESVRETNSGELSIETEILHVLLWRKAWHSLNAQALKLAKEERGAARESNRKELDGMEGKIVMEKMKERIKNEKAMKEMEEEEKGENYEKTMGKLQPSGVLLSSPHFPIALMISEFIFTRSNLFPSNCRLPMTEEIVDALSAKGKEKEVKAKKVTLPIVNILMEMLLQDDQIKKRYAFCDTSISKLKLDEYSVMELLRVLVCGERPSTKEERDKFKDEMEEGKDKEGKREEEGRSASPEEREEDEDEKEGDITLNEDDRLELVAALEDCDGRWDAIEGEKQGKLMEFLLNFFLDSAPFEIKTDVELQEEYDDLKKEKKELKIKMEETKTQIKVLKDAIGSRESIGLRLPRAESAKMYEAEETKNKQEKRMEEINTLIKSLEKELDLAKYGNRLDAMGRDRHDRRYMLMPHYAGLLIQSTGSAEWIEEDDGSEYFGFVPSEEEWRRVMSVKEWDELSEKLKNGSKSEKKLMKAMEKNKEKFESGLAWHKKVEENKKNDEMEDDDTVEDRLSGIEAVRREMTSLLEKSENGELLKVKEISILNRKTKEAHSIEKWISLLLELERLLVDRSKENNALFKVFRMVDDTMMHHSFIVWRSRVKGVTRLSELLMLMRIIDYRIVWNQKDIDREKEAKKKEAEEKRKKEEEKEEEGTWAAKGIHTRSGVESKDKKEVRDLMKKVIDLASGRLASTLNTLESDDERMMNLKDIEEECHRYSLERFKKVLRKNMERWRDEIETRIAHRIDQFDEFAIAVHKLL
ncbi:hypothetical protein PMAYCL1PPCAC_18348, partial [Pristionchus mayeri]